MKELVYINRSNKDYCEVSDLVPNWETILANYMQTHYIACNTYEVHHNYFIAIDDTSDDTIEMLNRAKVTIYHIDNIVGFISIRFKDEASRDLVFNVLKEEVV